MEALYTHVILLISAPDAVVIPHHEDALRVRQVAVLDEEVEDASAAELELLPDDALQVRHHATRVQVHEQPAHAAVDDGRRRIVKEQAHADKLTATGSHHCEHTHTLPRFRSFQPLYFRSGFSKIKLSTSGHHLLQNILRVNLHNLMALPKSVFCQELADMFIYFNHLLTIVKPRPKIINILSSHS